MSGPHGSNGSSEDSFDRIVFDEAFVAAASIKEPSAKQRQGGPLSRRNAARGDRDRDHGHGHFRPIPRGRRRLRGAASVTLAVALAAGMTALVSRYGFVPGAAGPRAHRAGARPSSSGSASASRTANGFGASGADAVNAAPAPNGDPFAGSPAERFADGAAGITFPAPAAAAGFSTAEVRRLYQRSRELLTASQLDRPTLRGGNPAAFTAKLEPAQRTWFVAHLKDRSERTSSRLWVTAFAPHTAELRGTIVKVHGTTSAAPARDSGHTGLKVRLNYLFVYPVSPPGRPGTVIRVVAHVRGDIFHYREGGALHSLVGRWSASYTPVHCKPQDGFVHPMYPDEPAAGGAPPTGAPVDPYDLRPDKNKDCHASDRT